MSHSNIQATFGAAAAAIQPPHSALVAAAALLSGHGHAGSSRAVLDAVAALRAASAATARPDILENLTYHALERDDLSLDECLSYLAEGWATTHGRTPRQMVLQLTGLLAAGPRPEHIALLAQMAGLAEEAIEQRAASSDPEDHEMLDLYRERLQAARTVVDTWGGNALVAQAAVGHEAAFETALMAWIASSPTEALAALTGNFVGLTLELLRQQGHEPKGEVLVDGGELRDITIHAPKVPMEAARG